MSTLKRQLLIAGVMAGLAPAIHETQLQKRLRSFLKAMT